MSFTAILRTDSLATSSLATWSSVALLAFGLAGCSEGGTEPSTGNMGGSQMGNAGSGAGGTSAAGSAGAAGSTGEAGTTAGTSSGTGGTGVGVPDNLLNLFDFATDTAGWGFSFADPLTLIPPPAEVGPDGGVVDPGPPPEGVATAAHDAADGSPDLGSVLLNLPFSTINQKVSYEITIADGDVGVDLTGRTLSCRIKVDSGLSTPDGPAGLKLYVKSGATSLYADGGWNNIDVDGEWHIFNWGVSGVVGYVDPAGTHNPADVRQVGIEIATGSAGVFSEAVIHFDSFGY